MALQVIFSCRLVQQQARLAFFMRWLTLRIILDDWEEASEYIIKVYGLGARDELQTDKIR